MTRLDQDIEDVCLIDWTVERVWRYENIYILYLGRKVEYIHQLSYRDISILKQMKPTF
jgi:hypothetical protein